jgi:hypothetical protein
MEGFIYVFKMVETNFYKIGMTETESVKERFTQFKTYAPSGAEITMIIEADNAREKEKFFHELMKVKRKNGEWFELNEDDLNLLRSYINEKTQLMNKFFWEKVALNNASIADLKKTFEIAIRYNKERVVLSQPHLKLSADILEYINENLTDTVCSASDVLSMMIEDKVIKKGEIAVNMLGRIIKTLYTQEILTVKGHRSRVYRF